jgi:polyhydroxyalkanoate synthesis regulator phasin
MIDYKFLEDNIDEFIKTYFEFNSDNRARKKQYRDRWLNTIGRESNSKDNKKISKPTILYIQEIIKSRHEKAEGRKLIKNTHIKNLENRISSLEKQIQKIETWRAITQVLSKNLKDKNPQEYYQLIDELGVNKGYYGL